MFEELGSRFKKGTINLSITMCNETMTVMVSFKGLPTDILPRVMTGTPKEIDDDFIVTLEQPMSMASAYNSKMDQMEKILKDSLEAKKKEVDKAIKPDAKTSIKASSNQASIEDIKAKATAKIEPAKEIVKVEEKVELEDPDLAIDIDLSVPEPEKEKAVVVNIRLSEKQKKEIIQAGITDDPFDGPEMAVKKLREIKGIDEASARVYFDNNLKASLDSELENHIDEEKKHASNIEKMKEEISGDNKEDDFSPFDDEEFNL